MKKAIKSAPVTKITTHPDMEQLFIKINHNKEKFLIGSLYIPPSSSLELYEIFTQNVEKIKNILKDHLFILAGDFNLTKITWVNTHEATEHYALEGCNNPRKNAAEIVGALMSSINLEQCFPSHPEKGYTLDLLFADKNIISYMHSSDYIVPLDKHHHLSATFCLESLSIIHEKTHLSRCNFNKMDVEACNHCLNQIDWAEIVDLDNQDVNSAAELYNKLLYEAIDLTVPQFSTTPSTIPKWYTKELIDTINRKKELHKLWKINKDLSTHIELKKNKGPMYKINQNCQKRTHTLYTKSSSKQFKTFLEFH